MIMDRKEKNSDNKISSEVSITKFVGGIFIICFIILFVYGGKHLLNPNTFPIKYVKSPEEIEKFKFSIMFVSLIFNETSLNTIISDFIVKSI